MLPFTMNHNLIMLPFTMNHNVVLTHAITAVPESTHKGGTESDLISDLIVRQ